MIQGPRKDDICYATTNRQDAVRQLALECGLVLVVGSQNSSNSNRLRELAERCGAEAYLIDGPERSEEHTSELQSRGHLVCRLLLEKKKISSGDARPPRG